MIRGQVEDRFLEKIITSLPWIKETNCILDYRTITDFQMTEVIIWHLHLFCDRPGVRSKPGLHKGFLGSGETRPPAHLLNGVLGLPLPWGETRALVNDHQYTSPLCVGLGPTQIYCWHELKNATEMVLLRLWSQVLILTEAGCFFRLREKTQGAPSTKWEVMLWPGVVVTRLLPSKKLFLYR